MGGGATLKDVIEALQTPARDTTAEVLSRLLPTTFPATLPGDGRPAQTVYFTAPITIRVDGTGQNAEKVADAVKRALLRQTLARSGYADDPLTLD